MQAQSKTKRFRSLDWLNFFVADVQTGVGPFLAAALTARGWNPAQVGTLLTLGGLAGLGLQPPAGALVDNTRRKRTLVALGVICIVAASLILAFSGRFASVLTAQLILASVGPFIGPAITAITLGLVGKTAFDARLGRNASFNSAGNLFAALLMGWVGWRWSVQAIFFTVPVLAVPALLALAAIPGKEIDHALARGSDETGEARHSLKVVVRDTPLLAFAASAFLFHLSNAAMLPQLGEVLAHGRVREAAPFMSAAVSVTQLVVALTASFVGRASARVGPKAVLMLGYGVMPIRGLLYTMTNAVPLLTGIQILDGVANSIFGVASAVYVAQRTRGSGHFNLPMGAFGVAVGGGAALSNVLAGFVAQHAGFSASFLVLAAVAAGAFVCLALFVPGRGNSRVAESNRSVLAVEATPGVNIAE
jgi:MFS family permease